MLPYQLQHQLYQGGQSEVLTRQLMERGHAAAVLLFDPKADALVLIEQFRIGAKDDQDPWLIELVAGVIEEGESGAEVAKRESVEEAGLVITQIEPIYEYYVSPGGCSEKVSLYYAEVDSILAGGVHGLASEGEDIKVHVVPFQQALAWLDNGKMNSATPIMALQWLQLNHQRLLNRSAQ